MGLFSCQSRKDRLLSRQGAGQMEPPTPTPTDLPLPTGPHLLKAFERVSANEDQALKIWACERHSKFYHNSCIPQSLLLGRAQVSGSVWARTLWMLDRMASRFKALPSGCWSGQ